MRAKYVLSEVLVGLWRNLTMTIAMIVTMAVSLTMVGASYVGFKQVGQMEDFYYAKLEVSVFLVDTITEDQRSGLDSQLRADPLIREVLYESKDLAYANFKRIFSDAPDLVNSVKPGDLPESFRLKLKDPTQFGEVFTRYNGTPGIDQIVDQRNLLDRIFKIFDTFQLIILVVAGIMAFAALLLVGNMIQVAAFNKRREVAVMKLVGASNWFIQAPFVLEAVFAGIAGALIAFGLMAASKAFLIDGDLSSLTEYLTVVKWSTIFWTLPIMLGVGTFVSSVTAWVTLRFYLRV
ncbi:permease-like cell division protein FtsX [Pilimelia columellifera]|uniref:Cell division protein FtsX n=1 Tax=Pilimelia columellifera subsp. columellifera TaxID=706583 RepID=A0ABN3NJY4_9ACTN